MSRRAPWRSMSIFHRTLLLLVGSLLLVQLVSIVLIITLPPPRPFFVGMSELGDVLTGTLPSPKRHRRLEPAAHRLDLWQFRHPDPLRRRPARRP